MIHTATERLVSEVAILLAATASLVLWTGCASGDFGSSCANDDDCAAGAQCIADVCQAIDGSAPGGRDTGGEPTDSDDGPRDTGGPSGEDTAPPVDSGAGEDTGNGGNDTGRPDTAPTGCDEECGLGEACENGTCVTQCDPACTGEQQCIDLGDGPECLFECDEAGRVGGCIGNDELCRDIDPDQNEELLLCIPSQCSDHSDCQAGSCLQRLNNHGSCISNGPKQVGEACDLSNANEFCERGAVCIRNGTGTAGTCRTMCDPWAESPGCGSGELCSWLLRTGNTLSFLSLRQGYCTPQTESQIREPYAQCAAEDNMCDHVVRCLGQQNPQCFKWCRPGEGDCVGEVPGVAGICHTFTFPGLREVGQCRPRCGNTNFDCGDGFVCQDNMCRQQCSTSSDCCGGSSPCNYACTNGLCE